MLRRMVRRRSTRSPNSRILNLRDRRKPILRNMRNDISSSEAKSSCETLEKSIFRMRRSALAPETALPSASGRDASPTDSMLKVRELAFDWLVLAFPALSEVRLLFGAEVFQNESKSSKNRSHSSFDEVTAVRKVKA